MNLRFAPVLMLSILLVIACGVGSTGVTTGKKVALLLPGTGARYEAHDRPAFSDKLSRLCSDCQVSFSAATQGADQEAQAKSAIAGGASVIVLDPVDATAAAKIVTEAKTAKVPVISYDGLVMNTADLSYYVGFDNTAIGQLQANALLTALGSEKDPNVVELDGDPNDKDAILFKTAVHKVLDGKVHFVGEYSTPASTQAASQTEMQNALHALGETKLHGVLAANDAIAAGAIAVMKSNGLKPLPPVTGQGAELAAIQRIVAGDQYMTVYESLRVEAETAAQLAYDLAYGVPVPASMTNGSTVNNGTADVPSALVAPVAVIKDNIESTVVADGLWSAGDICTSQYMAACAAQGIS